MCTEARKCRILRIKKLFNSNKMSEFVGLNCENLIIMQRVENVKFFNTQRAKQIYHIKSLISVASNLCRFLSAPGNTYRFISVPSNLSRMLLVPSNIYRLILAPSKLCRMFLAPSNIYCLILAPSKLRSVISQLHQICDA